MSEDSFVKSGMTLVGLIIGLSFIFVFFSPVYIIHAGERGVVSTFGDPSMTSYSEGIHFKIPFVQSVTKFDIKTLKYETEATSASSDLQTVNAKLAINYHLEAAKVPEIYQTIGVDYETRVIAPFEQEIIKAVTAKFTAEELITKREAVRDEIKSTLKDRLAPRGIIVEELSITNFDFSKSFNDAIEAKVTAEQSALAAKNKLEQIKYEAEQKVASAKAEAEALSLQKNEITPDLIRLRQIEVQKMAVDKWDGHMPLVVGSATPFIDMSSMLGGNVTR